MEGWIRLHRTIFNWSFYFSEKFTKTQAWIDMILLANHSEKSIFIRGNEVKIQRGQIGFSEDSLAKRWKWSRTRVRNFLKMLKKEHQIDQQKSKVLGLITLVNYNLYQDKDTTDHTTDHTTEKHQTIQQKNTNNNDKNIKNDKNDNLSIDQFEKFWKEYPRKIGKKKSKEKFLKLKPDNILFRKIMESLELHKKTIQWQDIQYIPHAITWLNQERWNDEIDLEKEKNSGDIMFA